MDDPHWMKLPTKQSAPSSALAWVYKSQMLMPKGTQVSIVFVVVVT
jgi:hypothetical protein